MSQDGPWSLPWWERYPARLGHEIESLVAEGIRFSIDDEARLKGVLIMSVTIPARLTGSQSVQADIRFPEFYPQFRPQVSVPSLSLPHHQDPFGGNLCLIGRDSRMWSEGDTLAWLLVEQLPRVLANAELPDPDQGEPISHYFAYTPDAVFLIDSDHLPPPSVVSGTARIVVPMAEDMLTSGRPCVASVAEFNWVGGSARGSSTTADRLGSEAMADWVRLENVLDFESPETLWNEARHRVIAPVDAHRLSPSIGLEFVIILFAEEHAPGEVGTGALVVSRLSDPRTRFERRASKTPSLQETKSLIRTMRAGRSDLTARAPDLAELADRNVLIVGCGALGSTIADQLARSGVRQLALVDGDRLEPGNLMRHTASIDDVGLNKAAAVAGRAQAANPEITVHVVSERIGAIRLDRGGEGFSPPSEIPDIVNKAHLVIDATAEIAVHEVLSDIARADGVPYVYAEVTGGAWGGYVFSSGGAGGACWNCSELHIQKKTLSLPAGDPDATVQPVACAEPTFLGASVDVSEVALHAARTAIVVLAGGRLSSHLDTVELRDAIGERSFPQWSRQVVEQHVDCPWHE